MYKDDTVKCRINVGLALYQSKFTNVSVIEWGSEIVPIGVNLILLCEISRQRGFLQKELKVILDQENNVLKPPVYIFSELLHQSAGRILGEGRLPANCGKE